MRKISINPPDHEVWQRWIRDCEKATEELLSLVARGERPKVGRHYKRDSIKQSFFFSGDTPFFGKCAYCEAPIVGVQRGGIEHFRPKLGVTDENDRDIYLQDSNGDPEVDAEGEPLRHPGYYWLAYDWRNLLPTCAICNEPSTFGGKKIGKHNRFPVSGRHAQVPAEVGGEQELLINPASGAG